MLYPVFTDTHHVSSRFNTQLKQNALVEMLEQYQDRILFHLVLTYKPFHDRSYAESDVNKFFIKFYLRYFLPYLMNTSNYHRDSIRLFQPICLVFVDEHETNPVLTESYDYSVHSEYAARLHHHAILAVHHENVNRIRTLIGTNTLSSNFSHKIMTSYLRECSADTLLYASKMLHRYPDFLSFPDRSMSETNLRSRDPDPTK